MKHLGKVTLAGAGPGAPSLLTLGAAKALQEADIVLYDRLVNPGILAHAKRAKCLYAGKEPGIDSTKRQQAIIDQMIKLAKQGKKVVRLKGGDPFVFGRGGEEALALAKADIPFEVIPGVSSAIAAPTYAEIPITHRGVSAAFAVFAGQTEHQGLSEELWQAAASIPTAVFLMGVQRLPLIVAKLIEHGRAPNTSVAIISHGTLPEERVVTGTLATIVEVAKDIYPPSTIVVGPCVDVRGKIKLLRSRQANRTGSGGRRR